MNSAIKHWKIKICNALIVIPFMHEIAPFMQGGFFCINNYVRIQATGQI